MLYINSMGKDRIMEDRMFDEYYKQMMELGMSENEAKIYMALLMKRELTAMEIHEFTGIPRTKVYEITKKLILKGMCIEKKMGKKKMYQAVDPERAFNNLILEFKSDLDKRIKLASSISESLRPLFSKGMENVDVSDYIEIITNAPSIHEKYVCLVKNTQFEMLGFVRPPYAYKGRVNRLDEQEDAEFEILKYGVTVRVLYEYKHEEDLEATYTHIKKCVAAGEKARVIEELPIKMYVFDRRYVLMALDDVKSSNKSLTMIVIEHPGLAKMAAMLFDYLWDQAKDYTYLKKVIKERKKN
ncbi:MAG TPA: TrmB family transcriptional regulator [candidate division WOR-3 bacterium]|uniref:TrmB family transcriptional regulator n=1 Tax=candidate division WOR-3 bacterium TaxID=2052148 RepID=A0A7C0VA26_UNCW3|nr:TrmB family transcriptional regulator [candidate division WOR-3 bacterium]